jgi:hypothetical protein
MAQTEVVCACGCGEKFFARNADIRRGWGKFASKRCKAREQERRTGQYRDHMNGVAMAHALSSDGDNSWDGINGTYDRDDDHGIGFGSIDDHDPNKD